MEMEKAIVREVSRWGNGAGILLPKEWLDGRVRVELIERPLDVKADLLKILDEYLEDIVGIYIVGSYARGEQTKGSDVDVLVITNGTNDKIKKGLYDILLISKSRLEETLRENIQPLLPMLMEAKPVFNAEFIKTYKKLPLNRRNLRFHLETTKSAMRVDKEIVETEKLLEERGSDSLAYSLILRLRGAYIVDCMIHSRMWSTNDLKKLIKKVAGSTKAYDGYIRAKKSESSSAGLKTLPLEEANRLISYITKKINEQKKWTAREGNS